MIVILHMYYMNNALLVKNPFDNDVSLEGDKSQSLKNPWNEKKFVTSSVGITDIYRSDRRLNWHVRNTSTNSMFIINGKELSRCP